MYSVPAFGIFSEAGDFIYSIYFGADKKGKYKIRGIWDNNAHRC